MNKKDKLKFLFIINPSSGNSGTDWSVLVKDYFSLLNHTIELYQLLENTSEQTIEEKITSFSPDKIVAIGGDGTVNLVARCVMQKNIPMGILPAGSANGLAKEFGISDDPKEALDVLIHGSIKKIHAIRVNDKLCIHLSDVGLNAHAIKKFEKLHWRGMWGYLVASLKVYWKTPTIHVEMQINHEKIEMKAVIIIIANATKYGTGIVINPIGELNDELFEVVVVKKISLGEIFKMTVSHAALDPAKTEIFQTKALTLKSVKKMYFQVDGEYLGKVNEVNAILVPFALDVIVPDVSEKAS